MRRDLFSRWMLTAAPLPALAVVLAGAAPAEAIIRADSSLFAAIRGRRVSLPAAVFHDAHAPPLSRF